MMMAPTTGRVQVMVRTTISFAFVLSSCLPDV
jgi:hypothetical protein